MVVTATFSNIVVLVEEYGVPGENHRPDVSHWQTLSHNVDIEYTSRDQD
jgi:hypothetical protein